jgi:hypothetical protein
MLDNLKEWLSNIYEGIKGTIVNIYNGIKDALVNIWNSFLELVDSVFDWIWDVVVYCGQVIWDFFLHDDDGFVWWLLRMFGDWATWFIEQIPDMSSILGQYSSPITTAMQLMSKLDKFFPLSEAVSLLGIFIVFLLIFLSVKLILKLIPTVG